MRTLSWKEVEDILAGATALGCGGGGDYEEGRELMRRAYDEGRAVRLAAPDELADDAVVCVPYGVGGLTVGDEAVYAGLEPPAEHPSVLAVRALGEHLGVEFGALMTGELGGTSISDAFFPAAMLDLPVVDADPVGRAVPELEHSLFKVHGLPIAPEAVVNEIGDTVIVTRVADDARAEALVRALAVASRNLVWVADHALQWGELRDVVILGAIGHAQHVGEALRAAREREEDAAAAVAAAGRRPRRLPRPRHVVRVGGARRLHLGRARAGRRGRGRRLLLPRLVQEREPARLARRRAGRDGAGPHLLLLGRDRRAGHQPAPRAGRGRDGRRRPGRAAVAYPGTASPRSARGTSASTSTSYRWRIAPARSDALPPGRRPTPRRRHAVR